MIARSLPRLIRPKAAAFASGRPRRFSFLARAPTQTAGGVIVLLMTFLLAGCPKESAPPVPPPSTTKAGDPSSNPASDKRLGLTPAKTRRVALGGQTLDLVEQRYVPPFRLTGRPPSFAGDMKTPEGTLVAFVTMVSQGDWSSARMLYDPASRASFGTELKQRGLTEKAWAKVMNKRFTGAALEAYRRRTFGDYVLVYAAPVGEAAAARQSAPPMVLLKGADGIWRLTHALRGHPVMALTTPP